MQTYVDEFQQRGITSNVFMYTTNPEGCMEHLEGSLEDPSMPVGKDPIFPGSGQEVHYEGGSS